MVRKSLQNGKTDMANRRDNDDDDIHDLPELDEYDLPAAVLQLHPSHPLYIHPNDFSGLLLVNSFDAEKHLKKIGLGKEDRYFWKQIGKALLCTYTVCGVAWLYNETSPLGWWTLKPRPKEEKELAHLYERRKFPYPGDEDAMREFVEKGGMIGTTIGPKGIIETDKDADNYQKQLQDKKFEQEALKLWLRMRNEVVSELQEKGYDVE